MKNRTSHFVHRPSNNHYTTQDSLGLSHGFPLRTDHVFIGSHDSPSALIYSAPITFQGSARADRTESDFDQFKVANLGNSPAETLAGQKQNSYSMNSINSKNSITFLILFLLLSPKFLFAELENFQAADVVLGQPGFTSGTANNGGVSARSMSAPLDIYSDSKKLFLADFNNHRVLIWNDIPTTNFAAADVVIGQPNLSASTVNNGGVSARSLNNPSCVFSDGKKLFVSEITGNRVLIWNTVPTTNFTPADVVLGQPDFASNTANNGGVSGSSLSGPNDVFSDGKRLFIADSNNRRILIWNNIPNVNSTPADIVLGQPDLSQNTLNNGGISARSLRNPTGVFFDGKRLIAIDRGNHRVLIWNRIPTTNFTPADVVLGQPDFTSVTANVDGVSPRSLNNPRLIFSDGNRLFVTDQSNARLLIWNKTPTTNFTPADVVLGQPDFTQAVANNGGVSARSFSNVRDIFLYRGKLFVSDQGNNRVLVFNVASFKPTPDPQFEQGKAVVGKVFLDWNENGIQDSEQGRGQRAERRENKSQPSALTSQPLVEERGLEGIKVVSDTGIYAITDQDGKYHFPYIETGQRVLKLDESTLPEGSTLTTDNPYKATITKGILTKVSFGVRLPEETVIASEAKQSLPRRQAGQNGIASTSPGTPSRNDDTPLLQVSITQDTSQKPTKTLGITAELITPKGQSPKNGDSPLIKFTTTCNYYLFIKESMILLYDSNQKPLKTLTLPQPIPLYYELPLSELKGHTLVYYQLVVRDAQGHEDRTSVGRIEI